MGAWNLWVRIICGEIRQICGENKLDLWVLKICGENKLDLWVQKICGENKSVKKKKKMCSCRKYRLDLSKRALSGSVKKVRNHYRGSDLFT